MESVAKAKSRFRQYPLVLGKCKNEASAYAKCVLKRDSVNLNDCAEEFKLFRTCLQKTAASLKVHLGCAFLIRIALVWYGKYHDENFLVPYTDVDYKVFTDASRHVLNHTSPYNRHTYRYTPLIAILLTPNVFLDESFGKVLFSVCDVVLGLLIRVIVKKCYNEYEHYCKKNNFEKGEGKRRRRHKNEKCTPADYAMLLWLYNPLSIAIATRGNCDSIAGLLVLLTLYFLHCHWPFVAGLVHGVAIHVRLYPVMYSLTFFMYLSEYSFYSADYRKRKKDKKDEIKAIKDSHQVVHKRRNKKIKKKEDTQDLQVVSQAKDRKTIFKREYLLYLLPNLDQIKLISGCLLSLALLTGSFYLLYGYEFLYQSYIYHFVRKDTRHNFSLYFYLQYLTAGIKNIGLWQKFLIILPQAILIVVFSVRYGLNRLSLNFGILVQTIVMVAYNTVMTSQYFVWVLAVLPLCLWQVKMSKRAAAAVAVVWFTAQAAWLLPAYLLEFHGHNTFLYIWTQSVSLFCANMAILGRLMKHFMPLDRR